MREPADNATTDMLGTIETPVKKTRRRKLTTAQRSC